MRMLYVWSYVEHSAVVLQGSGYWWWRGGTICYGFLFVFVYSMLECNAADVLIVAGTKVKRERDVVTITMHVRQVKGVPPRCTLKIK